MYFNAYIIHRRGPMAEKYCCNKILMNFIWEREDGDKRRPKKNWSNLKLFFFQIYPFLDIYIYKISTFDFWVHGHSSCSMFGLHLVRA